MIKTLAIFAVLGYLAVKLPVTVFAYTPGLRRRPALLFSTISALFCGLITFAFLQR